MKIAIIGAGLCGLASAWHLLQTPKTQITIFDPKGPGGGASGIASGLLHYYAGAHAKFNWKGLEGMAATKKLLAVAEKAIGIPVAAQKGLLRLAVSEEQRQDYALCAKKFADVRSVQNLPIAGLNPLPGIFIESAMTVECRLYLEGLWKACQNQGALMEKTSVSSLTELQSYDRILITAGASTGKFKEACHLPFTLVKGQVLELDYPAEFPFPINSKAYLIKQQDSYVAGSTFERDFKNEDADQNTAIQQIIPKLSLLIPNIEKIPIIGCRAGIRVSTPDHLPLIKQLNDKCWILTGMGSKGLLYHGLYAEQVAKLIT